MANSSCNPENQLDNDTLRANADLYNKDGEAELSKNDFNSSLDFFTKGIDVKCNDDQLNAILYTNRATAHFNLGKYSEALCDAQAGRQFNPTYLRAIETGVSACVKLNLFEDAINWCDQGLANDPGNKKLLETRNMCTNARDTCGDESKKQQQEERAREAMAYAILGNDCLSRGDLKGAVKYHEQYLTITKEIGDRVGEGRACRSLGDRYYSLRDFNKAVEYHLKYLAISEEIGDRLGEGRACGSLGLAYYSLGNFNKATEYFQQHLSFTKEKGDKAEEGRAYGSLGNAHLFLGNFQKAIDFYQQRLSIAKDLGDKTGEGRACSSLGRAYFSLSNFEKAAEYHKLYLSFTKDAGDKAAECGACLSLGNDYLSLSDFQKATDFYQLGLSIAKEVGDKAGEGRAYGSLGNARFRRGEFQKALDYFQRELEIAKEIGDRAGEGRAHCNLGSAYYSFGSFKDAIASYKSSLDIATDVGDRATEGRVYGNLGNVYDSQGLVDKALECHQLRLSVAKELGDRVGEASAYLSLGNAYHFRGDFTKAIDHHNLCLGIAKEVGDRHTEGKAYGNLGSAYRSTGNFQLATDYHKLELKTAEELGDKAGEGLAYGNLGIDYRQLGDFNKAIKYQEKSLRVAEEVGDRVNEGKSYGNLGNAYFSLGNFKKAIENLEKRLQIAEELGDRAGQGYALGNLGCGYLSLGDFEKAMEHYQLRLSVAKEIGDRAGEGHAYGNIGNVYDSLGNREEAIKYHQICLGIAKEVKDKDLEGNCYCNLGVVYHSLGDVQKSIEYHRQHLSISRESGDTVGQGLAYGNLGESYHSLGDLSRSEDFYQLSVEQYDAVRNLLQPNDDEWKISLRDRNDEVYTALVTVLLKQDKITEALLTSERGRAQALMDLMKSQYGVHLALSQPGVKQSDIVKTINNIASRTVFIAAGARELNFWVLQKEEDVTFRRKEIDNAYLKKDVFESLQSLTKNAYDEIRVNRDVQCENRALEEPTVKDLTQKRSEEDGEMSHSKSSSLRNLYELIINPISDLIQGSELIIVPDGPLFLAPFAAFHDRCSKFLCESFTLRLVPSLSTLKLMAERSERCCSEGEALLVGDPWVAEIKRKGKRRLEQLKFAKKEVEMIGKILNVTPLVREKATKAEVVRRLASAPLVHIAAHGSMETGEIALSPNPPAETENERPYKKDYMLKMEDVLKIQLRARLVVLSCCHSAHGEIKAEGVVGIARAFLGAGARSVLVSLWAIDDEATLEFMRCFYQHLVEGKRTSEAINQARKCLRESERFSDVKHWAPFMLVGDDVTLDVGEKE